MSNNTLLVIYDEADVAKTGGEKVSVFSLPDASSFWYTEVQKCAEQLDQLVFLVTKKPKCLANHLRRIYFCFDHHLNEQLFAAIVDFLVVLNGQGSAISWRVILGTKSLLNAEQFNSLKAYLKSEGVDTTFLVGNQYSVFSKGLIGSNKVVTQIEQEMQDNDPLMIAIDHIQYCQLDEAKKVLEDAILLQPDREDLRQELCELYKSTGDLKRFHQMLAKLARAGIALADDWNQLNLYFKGQNNNG